MKKYKGFSLIEVLLLFAALSVILAVSAPLISKQHKNVPQKMPHGFYQCYRDENGTLHEELYNTFRKISSRTVNEASGESCSFAPPQEATMFKITLIGAGMGGYIYANVNEKMENFHSEYHPENNDYSPVNHLYRALTDSEFREIFNGAQATYCSPRSAKGGDASGVQQKYYTTSGLKCEGTPTEIDSSISGWELKAQVAAQSVQNPDNKANQVLTYISSKTNLEDAKYEAEIEWERDFQISWQDADSYITSIEWLGQEQIMSNAEEVQERAKADAEMKAFISSYSGLSNVDIVLSNITSKYDALCKAQGYTAGAEIGLNQRPIGTAVGSGGAGPAGVYAKYTYDLKGKVDGDYKNYLHRVATADRTGSCSVANCSKTTFSTSLAAIKNGADGTVNGSLVINRGAATSPGVYGSNSSVQPQDGKDGEGYAALEWTNPENTKVQTYHTVKYSTKGTLGDVVLRSSGDWKYWDEIAGTGGNQDPNGVESCTRTIPYAVIDTERIVKKYILGSAGLEGKISNFTKFGLGKLPCQIYVGKGAPAHKPDSPIYNTDKGFFSVDTVLSCSGVKLTAEGGRERKTGQRKYTVDKYIPTYVPKNGSMYVQGIGPVMEGRGSYVDNDYVSATHSYNLGVLNSSASVGIAPKFIYPSLWLRYLVGNKKDIPFGKGGDGTQLWDKCTWPQGTMTYYATSGGGQRSININKDANVGKCSSNDYSGVYTGGSWSSQNVSAKNGVGGGVFIRW